MGRKALHHVPVQRRMHPDARDVLEKLEAEGFKIDRVIENFHDALRDVEAMRERAQEQLTADPDSPALKAADALLGKIHGLLTYDVRRFGIDPE